MAQVNLEHVNITVKDAKASAENLCSLFDWKIRWHGEALDGQGVTYHVGSSDTYLALYTPKDKIGGSDEDSYHTARGLNHIAVTVDDLDAMEAKVIDAGYKTGPQWDYEPGRRFYFDNEDGIEIEVGCYA